MEDPIIDIVIPNWNKAEFLPRTLTSLWQQTETRWRAIVIDGTSTDGSLAILGAAAQKDPRFVVYTAQPSSVTGLSLYRSWNQGLMHVRAPFFAILTSDDTWEPTWLHTALDALATNPMAVAAAARAVSIDAEDNIIGPTIACQQFEDSFPPSQGNQRILGSDSCTLRALLLGPIFSTIHSLVFRSKMLEDGVIFAEDIGYLADVEYYLHTCLRGDIIYEMGSSAFFRVYETQQSSAAKGTMISRLWRKVVSRNRSFVAQRLGIPIREIIDATDEILARHKFIMTKPDRATFSRSKSMAAWRMLHACVSSPRLAREYLRSHADREEFLTRFAAGLALQLSAKYGLS